MLKKVGIGVGVIAALLVAIVAFALITKPDHFEVKRSLSIQSPPEPIYALIADFKKWTIWSPYDKLDPNMKRTYGGTAGGVGSTYAWEGNKDAGAGNMQIVEAKAPTNVQIKLDFTQPLEGHNIAEFTLVPDGDKTNVTWSMRGPSPAIMRVMGLFLNCDEMIGKDFEKGLQNIQAEVQKH